MNFNFKFSNYQNLYIFFLLFALIKIFFSTGNLYAKGFNINNVEISTKFEINFNRDYVLDEGFDLSFNKLIQTILKSEDQKKINNTSLNEIKSMIETFSIKEEKFINQIYYLSLDVTFNKKQIFEFLEVKNIFPSLPIKNKIFLLPIIFDENKNEMFVFSDNFILNNINEAKDFTREEIKRYIDILNIFESLDEVIINISQKYLDGEIRIEKAVRILQKYGLESEVSAIRRMNFVRRYRSYIINYTLGKRFVKNYIEKNATDETSKWNIYKELIEKPYLPDDLKKELENYSSNWLVKLTTFCFVDSI